MSFRRRSLLSSFGLEGDAQGYLRLARELAKQGSLRLAATAYDRAYGLTPNDEIISSARQELLDQLAVVEHGIAFRYIPAGSFLMGYSGGDADEHPVHVVELGDYWLSEEPISWALYCDLMDWEPAPIGVPHPNPELEADAPGKGKDFASQSASKPTGLSYSLNFMNRIRLQYCEDGTLGASDWHAHAPELTEEGVWKANSQIISKLHLWRLPERVDPDQPWTYSQKPLIAVGFPEAAALGAKLSSEHITYRLPTEAEWEKAARGGLIDCNYPWGNEPPTPDRCDFNRFEQFSIQTTRRFPPNSYGLYAMSGGVWEWTGDWYDAAYYTTSPPVDPTGPETGAEKVIRGGSWADCGEVLRVSFRASCPAATSIGEQHATGDTPNIGFRLCRVEHPVV